MKNYLLSYGTLRSGNINPGESENDICRDNSKIYNFDRFGFGSQKFIKKLRLKGFSLVDLKFYPAAIEDENEEITVELQEVIDVNGNKVMDLLRRMELNAGYKEKKIIIDNIQASIFIMSNLDKSRYLKIVGGDWCKK